MIWQPIEIAPKDGTPILAWCNHDADPYYLPNDNLTVYAAHSEGMSHAPDGYNIVEWGGAFDDSTWECPGASLPDWWFVYNSDFEIAANPIFWHPLPKPPNELEPHT